MSRSYKKHPVSTDGRRGRVKEKRRANKIFRKYENENDIKQARAQYKKVSCSWDIHDYISRMSYNEAISWYTERISDEYSEYFKKSFPTLKSWLNYWEKCYKRK